MLGVKADFISQISAWFGDSLDKIMSSASLCVLENFLDHLLLPYLLFSLIVP